MILVLGLKAQQESSIPAIYASFHSYASGGKELPFWLRANQNGTFPVGNSTTQLLRAGFYRPMNQDSAKKMGLYLRHRLSIWLCREILFSTQSVLGRNKVPMDGA